eukprot:SAG31_NODE_26256_length_445_cov_1.410405_2_plen_73_part_00
MQGNTMIKRMQSNGLGGMPKTYASSLDCAAQILKQEGVGGFYKGLWVQIIKGMPNAMIQFMAYDAMKALLGI